MSHGFESSFYHSTHQKSWISQIICIIKFIENIISINAFKFHHSWTIREIHIYLQTLYPLTHLDSIPFMDIYVQILYPLMHLNYIHGQFMKFINVSFCGEKLPNDESNNGATTYKMEKNKKTKKSLKTKVFYCDVVTMCCLYQVPLPFNLPTIMIFLPPSSFLKYRFAIVAPPSRHIAIITLLLQLKSPLRFF